MKYLTDIPNLDGVKVLVRVDFNVPIQNKVVTDDFRIRVAMPTIDFLRSKGARLILISHIESIFDENPSLAPVADYLKKKGLPVTFIKNIVGAYEASEQLKDGDIVLIENIRENDGEKKNDIKFAKQLATLADIYVNDAFSVSHREHASICAITQFLPSYAGLQLQKEIENLSAAFDPSHPFTFILGGAKFDTKLPLINKFLTSTDTIFIGGALANDALKARGCEIGQSKTSNGTTDISGIINQSKVMLPADVVVQDHSIKEVGLNGCIGSIEKSDMIFDAGPATVNALKDKINSSKFILWNGPLGLFEKGFTQGTEDLAKLIATRTEEGVGDGVRSIIGGGDTLSAISKLGIEDKFTFVSGGGGAMLDFLAQGTLVGIQALENSKA